MAVKLISLNMEGDKHLPQVTAFLKQEHADVVCLQEILKDNLPRILEQTGYQAKFFPIVNVLEPTTWAQYTKGEIGVAIVTKEKVIKHGVEYYFGGEGALPIFDINDINRAWRALVWAEIEKDGKAYMIANTHFTWTPEGEPNTEQRRDIGALLKAIDHVGNCILCGDFNVPRGARLQAPGAPATGGQGEIWKQLAGKLKDNIPENITTTIDAKLHRHGPLQLVVDGLFSSLNYNVKNVEVIGGISDHMAIVAEIN